MSEIRFNLTPYIDDLTEILKEIALKRYGKSIVIIAMYGSRARGDFEPDSDLEFFSVIEDGKKVDVEFTFHGIACDMWGQTWDYFEKVAKLDNYWVLPAGTMKIGKIIYARSEEDKNRFESLVNEATQPMKYYKKHLHKATEIFKNMFEILGRIQFAKFSNDAHEAREACWGLIIRTTELIAHVNRRSLTTNWGVNLKELFTFENLPEDLPKLMEMLVTETDFDNMLEIGSVLFENVRQYMISATENNSEESGLEALRTSDGLAYLNKMKKAGRNKDIFAAGYAVHDFQSALARDVLRLDKQWNQAMKFKLYNEYKEKYEEKYNDFFDAISNRDFKLLQKQADSMYDDLLEYNKSNVPDFHSLNEIKEKYL